MADGERQAAGAGAVRELVRGAGDGAGAEEVQGRDRVQHRIVGVDRPHGHDDGCVREVAACAAVGGFHYDDGFRGRAGSGYGAGEGGCQESESCGTHFE